MTGVVGRLPTANTWQRALYLRSVCVTTAAFRGLRCHPLTCIVLKLRLVVLSNPIAPTNNFSLILQRYASERPRF